MRRGLPQGLLFLLSWQLACSSNPPEPHGALHVVTRGQGQHAVLLMHGYGARGDDLVPLGERLASRLDARFVMPAAPFVWPHGPPGRMWFERGGNQAQSVESGRAIDGVFDSLRSEGVSRIVLAGFSQGAMMSLERGLRSERRPAALILFSGAAPRELGHDGSALRGMPMFISHGTRDPILPFDGGRDIARRAEAAGAHVVFVSFDGGHEIPPEVVDRAVSFLRDVFSP